MGGIKEHYLHFKNAGDQYLGRVVAGLDCNEYLFPVSPPYFDPSTVLMWRNERKPLMNWFQGILLEGVFALPDSL